MLPSFGGADSRSVEWNECQQNCLDEGGSTACTTAWYVRSMTRDEQAYEEGMKLNVSALLNSLQRMSDIVSTSESSFHP